MAYRGTHISKEEYLVNSPLKAVEDNKERWELLAKGEEEEEEEEEEQAWKFIHHICLFIGRTISSF